MKHPALESLIRDVSNQRQAMIDEAKAKGPTAAFHVKLIRMNQAVEKAQQAARGNYSEEIQSAIKEMYEASKI